MPAASPHPSSAPHGLQPKSNVHYKRQAEDLYERCCAAHPLGYAFSLAELLRLTGASYEQEVLDLTDTLIDKGLFILCKSNDGQNEASWKARDRKQAEIIQKFTLEERVVYERIADAQREGAWMGNIRARTGLYEGAMRKIIKDLKARNLVKEMKSVKAGQRKLLILYELEPSESSSGGPFYQDAELDEGLVQSLSFAVCRFIERHSWDEDVKLRTDANTGKKQGKVAHVSKPVTRDLKRIRDELIDKDEASSEPSLKKRRTAEAKAPTSPKSPSGKTEQPPLFFKPLSPISYLQPLSSNRRPLVPQLPSNSSYPTRADVFEHIQSFAKSAFPHVILTQTHLDTLLDMLIFDDRLERTMDNRFRAVRRSFQRLTDHTNTEGDARESKIDTPTTATPCGKCPVSDICEVGGPNAPEKCEYFRNWLSISW